MKVLIVIPSRWKSSRFVGKSLALINKIPMIERVYKRALQSKQTDDVCVATDNKKILNFCKARKIKVIMTSKKCKTGTDRVYEVSKKINSDIYVNLQGDEPLIDPKSIDKVILWHQKNHNFDIVVPSLKVKNIDTPHIVKIVKSNKRVLYFSRAKIPFPFKKNNDTYLKHLSVISFKPKALKKFKKLKESHLEKIEGIELMRALENNMQIGTFELKGDGFSVDTKDDFIKAKKYIVNDQYRKEY